MNRVELKEEMMEQVNGGYYKVMIQDPKWGAGYVYNLVIGNFTYKDEMLKTVKVLTDHGMYVTVEATSILFDDDSVCGVYSGNDFTHYTEFFGV